MPARLFHRNGLFTSKMMITDLEVLFQKAVKNNRVIGAALGYIENKNINYRCCGFKSIQNNDPIAIDTYFEIGSITKVFTALLLIQLVERGEMQLDDAVETLNLPFKIPEFQGTKITFRHLVTHHAGLPIIQTNLKFKNQLNPYSDYSIRDLYDFLTHYTLKNAPGDHFEYSNIGMGLLGHVLCTKTRKSYWELLSESILAPLSMNHTCLELTETNHNQMSKGHYINQILPSWNMSEAMQGSGGLLITIQDAIQFLAANLGLIQSPVTELLKRCHQFQYKINSSESIGLAWIITHSKNGDIIWHDGITGGYRSFIGFNRKTEKGMVILTNSNMDWVNDFALELLRHH